MLIIHDRQPYHSNIHNISTIKLKSYNNIDTKHKKFLLFIVEVITSA